jgi:hypothetical protein
MALDTINPTRVLQHQLVSRLACMAAADVNSNDLRVLLRECLTPDNPDFGPNLSARHCSYLVEYGSAVISFLKCSRSSSSIRLSRVWM